LRLFSFGGYGLALAALSLVVFGAIECPPKNYSFLFRWSSLDGVTLSPHLSRQLTVFCLQLCHSSPQPGQLVEVIVSVNDNII